MKSKFWISPVPGTNSQCNDWIYFSLSIYSLLFLQIFPYNPRIGRGQLITCPSNHSIKFMGLILTHKVRITDIFRHVDSIAMTATVKYMHVERRIHTIFNEWVLINIFYMDLNLMMNDTDFVAIRKRSALFNHTPVIDCV